SRDGRVSVRPRHAQDVLADVGEHEVVVDGRGLVEPALAELPLDVVLLGVAVPAVAIDAGVAGLPRRLGGEVLGHVGLGPARLARVEERRRLVAHERSGLDAGVGLGDRELHALVGAERLAEEHALARVRDGPLHEPAAVADRFRRDQDARSARYLAMLASGPHGSPASKSAAALLRMSAAASTPVWALAIGNCTPWLAPSGLPKSTRWLEYATARSTNQRPSPIDSDATRMRDRRGTWPCWPRARTARPRRRAPPPCCA